MVEYNKLPKFELGFFPTPVHKLDRLSNQLGVNLYLKRDDLTGPNLFGGNKIRKLEYLVGDALKQGADTLITFGATQSNHAMETAVAARKAGLDVILYLETITPNKAGDDRANILVDKILGAKIHYVSMADRTEAQADAFAMEEAKQEAAELAKTGHKAYIIPVGGATPIGSTGFALGFKELIDQLPDVAVDYIVQGSGTGGTAAGLIAGAKAFSRPDHPTEILSINVSPKPEEHYQKVVNIANDALDLLGLEQNVSLADTHFDQSYFGDGYEIPSESGSAAIQLLARTEGILTDPVYTGKAFAGLLDYVKTGKIKPGSNVVFWHTGGVSALFAEDKIVGKLY
ncbi:D-cysteine desulfhydrase family protein [Secundilactobacillus collinoides]|uniref:D-cysteine desulfhydrase n=2 Tax=Secundilactobacillus collinoides TaxID=33960 RepID=A0A0R2B180_SECCO|nr:D-cysteine desulfhydrase family protein [Secundilactobacillus collinoides]KRM73329.1 D-cysteine desulfhydrase [Secundilactobacillus collinoides DSM 20515 = JCM 1123]KZL42546.1 cysteine desulfhydrase [Secundilactobacillus collinoides]